MQDKFTIESFSKENIAIRGNNLIKIKIKNDKGEELLLHDIFEQIIQYIKDNSEKIDNSVALIASYVSGPFNELQRFFILGYLYSKYINKLETQEKCKYDIEYEEKHLSEEEIRNLIAEILERNISTSQDLVKRLKNGDINPNDIVVS